MFFWGAEAGKEEKTFPFFIKYSEEKKLLMVTAASQIKNTCLKCFSRLKPKTHIFFKIFMFFFFH